MKSKKDTRVSTYPFIKKPWLIHDVIEIRNVYKKEESWSGVRVGPHMSLKVLMIMYVVYIMHVVYIKFVANCCCLSSTPKQMCVTNLNVGEVPGSRQGSVGMVGSYVCPGEPRDYLPYSNVEWTC